MVSALAAPHTFKFLCDQVARGAWESVLQVSVVPVVGRCGDDDATPQVQVASDSYHLKLVDLFLGVLSINLYGSRFASGNGKPAASRPGDSFEPALHRSSCCQPQAEHIFIGGGE